MNGLPAKLFLCVSVLNAGICYGAPDSGRQLTVSSGTKFRVEVKRRTRLRKDRAIQGRLLDPIYSDNLLAVPPGAMVEGTIAKVVPATHKKRLDAKFHGDFTPLSEPVIQWSVLSRNADAGHSGAEYPLSAESEGGVGSTLYFRKAHAAHASLPRRAWNTVMGRKDAAVSTVTAPRKWERLQKYFWSQLPYHPQYLDQGTQYEMALTKDLYIAAEAHAVPANLNVQRPLEQVVSVHSRLQTVLDSGKAKPGDPVEAIVTEPVMNAQNQMLIPQGSILHGKVLRAVPSGKWGRNGILRFAFNDVSWPSGFRQNVEATPTAVEGSSDAKLQVDEEGGVVRQSNRNVAAPLIMGLLAASALGDDDGGLGKAAISSNGFALVGRLAAIGIGSRYVGGSIGAVGTGRSIYEHWLAHGKDTHFGSDTEVVLEMSPAHPHRMDPVQ
jgi:hypothetical protein